MPGRGGDRGRRVRPVRTGGVATTAGHRVPPTRAPAGGAGAARPGQSDPVRRSRRHNRTGRRPRTHFPARRPRPVPRPTRGGGGLRADLVADLYRSRGGGRCPPRVAGGAAGDNLPRQRVPPGGAGDALLDGHRHDRGRRALPTGGSGPAGTRAQRLAGRGSRRGAGGRGPGDLFPQFRRRRPGRGAGQVPGASHRALERVGRGSGVDAGLSRHHRNREPPGMEPEPTLGPAPHPRPRRKVLGGASRRAEGLPVGCRRRGALGDPLGQPDRPAGGRAGDGRGRVDRAPDHGAAPGDEPIAGAALYRTGDADGGLRGAIPRAEPLPDRGRVGSGGVAVPIRSTAAQPGGRAAGGRGRGPGAALAVAPDGGGRAAGARGPARSAVGGSLYAGHFAVSGGHLGGRHHLHLCRAAADHRDWP